MSISGSLPNEPIGIASACSWCLRADCSTTGDFPHHRLTPSDSLENWVRGKNRPEKKFRVHLTVARLWGTGTFTFLSFSVGCFSKNCAPPTMDATMVGLHTTASRIVIQISHDLKSNTIGGILLKQHKGINTGLQCSCFSLRLLLFLLKKQQTPRTLPSWGSLDSSASH